MTEKNKHHGTQKFVQIVDATNWSPLYEITSNKSNTKVKGEKQQFVCKCRKTIKKKKDKPKTWESITNLYGYADTPEMWDARRDKPKTLIKTKVQNIDKHETLEQKTLAQNNANQQISKHRNKKSRKKSIISVYRKPKKKKLLVLAKPEPKMEQNNLRSPVINIKLQQKPKKDPVINHYGTGDICTVGICNGAEEYYKLQKFTDNINETKRDKPIYPKHVCKCKWEAGIEKNEYKTLPKREVNIFQHKNNTTIMEKSKKPLDLVNKIDKKGKHINEGHGDQVLASTRNKTSNVKCKWNIIGKILRFSCKCKLDSDLPMVESNQTGEPFFEIKVDSENMHVINAEEIKSNVNTYGRLQKKRYCVCPSHKNRPYLDTCNKGICEKALRDKQTNFDCKCIIKNKIIECKDTTCDRKKIIKPKKRRERNKFYQSPTYLEKNKPLFEVMLDPVGMNIINTNEIHDIFRNASFNEICPTGVCTTASKNENIAINCKCVKKKIIPKSKECAENTCKDGESKKQCKLSYLCSRVISKSENWHDSGKNNNRYRHSKKVPRETFLKARSEIHRRNGLTFNVSRNNKHKQRGMENERIKYEHGVNCKYCECDNKVKFADNDNEFKEGKKRRWGCHFIGSKCRKKGKVSQKQATCEARIISCLKRKRLRCKRKLAEEEKEFKKKEKILKALNRKIDKKQERRKKKEALQWNCLTKFVSGILNVTTDTIKNTILGIFFTIANPIGSYVYVRETVKDPLGSIKRLKTWVIRTWRNKSGKLSKTIKESQTMNVIADQIENTAIYDTLFANKGRTSEEKALYENKKRIRQRRIIKRHDQALYGCRHMLLTTMRKTPCLWFYHICPDMYPQCLSLLDFMKNFLSVLIYLLAFLCWTPCIISFEICRAFLCCFFCTH